MNQPTAQFYHVTTDNQWPYRIYGAQQDNTTVSIASRSDDGVDHAGRLVSRRRRRDRGYIAPKPGDPNIVIAGTYTGTMTRYDRPHEAGERHLASGSTTTTAGRRATCRTASRGRSRSSSRSTTPNMLYSTAQYALPVDRTTATAGTKIAPRPHAARSEDARAARAARSRRHDRHRVVRDDLRVRRVAADDRCAVGGLATTG